MQVNAANLITLGIGFNAAYQEGLGQAVSQAGIVSTEVPSSTFQEEYGWIGKVPSVREWIGDRQVQNISSSSYYVKNKDFELTIGVDRNAIEDDNLGIYGPLFREMGSSVVAHKDQLVFPLLNNGFANLCFDGQPYFSNAHPVLDVNGNPTTYANTDTPGGGGTPWFLMQTTRFLKPLIFQNRKPFTFVPMDKPENENVFNRKEFVYGVDGRNNVGYGFPQFCWGSTSGLTPVTYATARAGLMALKGDYGRPLGIMPNLLVVPPSLETAARTAVKAELVLSGGAAVSNVWYNTADVLVVPWLS